LVSGMLGAPSVGLPTVPARISWDGEASFGFGKPR
jgi:hypothetical protein